MTVHVLGLGESLEKYEFDHNLTVGVNDVHSRVKTDYVVCVDAPGAFSEERQETIRNTKCKGFYTQCEAWSDVHNFKKIEFAPGRGFVDALDTDKFNYSISSPFVAAVLAYKLGAKEIVLHGVDFKTHPTFKDGKRDRAIEHFIKLNNELKKRGVQMFVGSSWSSLSDTLPIWLNKNQN